MGVERLRIATAAAANEERNLALVGVGGRGEWFVGALPGMRTRFAALCDTHAYRLNRAGEKFPEAKRDRDFRRMLDEMADRLDGVVVGTPDHSHAVITALALRAGKPVFCEKPLTRAIGEARALRELAGGPRDSPRRMGEPASVARFRHRSARQLGGAPGQSRDRGFSPGRILGERSRRPARGVPFPRFREGVRSWPTRSRSGISSSSRRRVAGTGPRSR